MSARRALTAEEEQTVREYAGRHGRVWKSVLREAWMNASEPGTLQALRNSHGPSWLASYKLPPVPELLCGRCGERGAAGAAGLCAACNALADEQEMIHERAHAGVSDPDTCDRGARCPMSVVPLTEAEAAALLAGDDAAWLAFADEARAWASEPVVVRTPGPPGRAHDREPAQAGGLVSAPLVAYDYAAQRWVEGHGAALLLREQAEDTIACIDDPEYRAMMGYTPERAAAVKAEAERTLREVLA